MGDTAPGQDVAAGADLDGLVDPARSGAASGDAGAWRTPGARASGARAFGATEIPAERPVTGTGGKPGHAADADRQVADDRTGFGAVEGSWRRSAAVEVPLPPHPPAAVEDAGPARPPAPSDIRTSAA